NNVSLTGAKPSTLCGLTITKNLTVLSSAASTTPTVIGDTAAGCSAGNKIGGDALLSGNAAPIDFSSNTVTGVVNVGRNSAKATAAGNRVQHDVVLQGNSGPVTLTNNTVLEDISASLNSGALTATQNHVTGDLAVARDTGAVTLTGNQVGHD